MKKEKYIILILSVLAVIFSVCTFLVLINYNLIYYHFNKLTTLIFLIFPFLSLILFVISSILIFRKNKISFIIPVAIALIGCILAFVLSNDASLSKIETDFLKHENEFNQVIVKLENKPSGLYKLNNEDLKQVIPVNKVLVESVGNNKFAYFFIALDAPDRFEGYVYAPYGAPEQWMALGEFSDELDIEKKWSYMLLHKGE